ncbi:ABC multidrug transporter B [Cladobotryum mycophilum]|uniref:ABC multidrug transporter B n=1 Tax=Cladobotryum mycophilum TaxID=491253 RepID=A0ABR0T3M2_9HYPO
MASADHGNLTETWRCDDSFGPFVYDCERRFDFTLLFQQSVLAIGPSALLLLVLPLRVLQLSQQKRKALVNSLAFSKLAACIVFGALQLGLLVQWTKLRQGSEVKHVSVAASGLNFVGALALCGLSYMEHSRSARPSAVISIYLVVAIAFDTVQCRTLWLLGNPQGLATVFSAMLASKLTLFILEMQGKRHLLFRQWRSLNPESTSGIISRSLFWWLNDFLVRGFRASLSLASLYDTDQELGSGILLHRLQAQWTRRRSGGKYALVFSLLHSIKGALLVGIVPRLCLVGFKFSQPFLMNRIIKYVQRQGGNGADPKAIGYSLIGATALVYIGTALSTGFYQHKVFRSLTMIRGALTSLVLAQSTNLGALADGSGALTLITADVSKISSAFENVHDVWAAPLELGLAMYLLERQLGLGCITPAIVVIVCTLAMGRLSKFIGPAAKAWFGAIGERVSITTNVLGSVKEVKMLGLSDSWRDAIQALRVKELDLSKKFRILIVLMNVLGNTAPRLVPVATFGLATAAPHLGGTKDLSVATVFTSLAIIGLIMEPLAGLLYSIPGLFSSLGCFERIQTFIEETECTNEFNHCTGGAGSVRGGNDEIELSTFRRGDSTQALIVAENVSFRIKESDEPILRDINISILPGSMTVIAGKVGSGKTTLIRGLLGQLVTTGRLKTFAGGAAYCAQTSWLMNSSIRQNILGQSEMDEQWYRTVVRACALERDFSRFPAGDLSVVGSKGSSLSGGQKQRVALARAVYARRRLMIIDDILSGLDWTTQRHVWDQVFGRAGLLRQHGIAVILATHSLGHLDDSEDVILLGDDGHIAQKGVFGTLRTSPQMQALLPLSNERNSTKGADASQDSFETQQYKPHEEEATDDEVDDTLNSQGDASLYLYYFQSIGWRRGLLFVLSGILSTFFHIFQDVWLRIWSEANDTGKASNVGMYMGIYAMIATLGLLFLAVDVWVMFVKVLPRSAQNLHAILLNTVMRFSKDMTLVDSDLPTAFYQTFSGFLSCVGEALLVLMGAKYLGAVLPLSLIFFYCLQKFYLRTSRQLRQLDLQATAPLHTHVLETLDGLSTIRAFGWQSVFQESGLRLLNACQKPHYLLFCIHRWLTLVLDLFVAATGVLLVIFAVVTPNATSAGAMALALTQVLGLSSSLADLISSWTSLETSLGAISRLRELETTTPAEGQIEFKDVFASYSSGEETSKALDGLTLTIKPGEKVAICGRTGSGKSSLISVLFRLLDLDAGAISIDGVDISHVAQNHLRQRLIAVPQEAMLFPGTLRSNLFPGSTAGRFSTDMSDDEIIRVLKKVELWAGIASLHGGLDTNVSDLGLSQGQKQLLCLARAVLRKDSSAILVLDEAMSAVDRPTEDVMVRVLEEEFRGHTIVSVVHRLNTVAKFDTVVVLDRGRMVEVGKPEELLDKGGGREVP